MSVEKILSEIFFDEVGKAISKLKLHGFDIIVENEIAYFSKSMKQEKIYDLEIVAISFHQKINTKLQDVKNLEEKEYLKYLLSSIGKYLIEEFFINKKVTHCVLEKLESAFESSAAIQGYNYSDFEKRLRLKRFISTTRNGNNEVNTKMNECKAGYYEVLKSSEVLDDIAMNLKAEKIIKSKKDFMKLFSSTPKKVNFNSEQKCFIITLFDVLYEHGIIKPKGNKGHFVPLKNCALDFENKILFDKEMKHIKSAIKKSKEKYNRLRSKAEKWLVI